MDIEQKENIKHIFRQALFVYHLINVALDQRDSLFKLYNDPLSNFFAEHCNEFSAHMAVINVLYDFLALPQEFLFAELNRNPRTNKILTDIKIKLQNISKIIYDDKTNSNKDLLRKLRNSLAHGRFILKEGGFIFKDQNDNGKNKIAFFIKAEDLASIIHDIEFKIIIPFVQDELQFNQE